MRFSIIVPCYHSNSTLKACLESLDKQSLDSHEVIVVDSTPSNDESRAICREFGRVRCHWQAERLSAHAARNFGARIAKGELLAFIDPDMTAAPNWLTLLDQDHKSGYSVVGGGVNCPAGYWPRAVHLTKYGWWLIGGPACVRSQLPSGNLSVDRKLFLEFNGFPDRFWEGDTEFSYRLRERGLHLRFLPLAETCHFDSPAWRGFLRERWLRGYDTGQARRNRSNWTWIERLARILAAPLVWIVMMGRSARHAFVSGWGGRWMVSSPVISAGLLAWVAGECLALAEPAN